ncbi:GNAT family N-acetyltransferase [Alteromonas confluentis]|uniref:Protein ElaA n=1 Tax=Alteromonas confluentis TaxID=1656094 RepID=A0A1E7ZEK9_9ALTE|nr:GNAT family N-acetyltransferase [Alteromonas confluentis]OFC71968.1 GNAT family N-acetyltransferase [Alteromonas confluentis]
MLTWQAIHFSDLSTRQLFNIMKERVDVFVVEQSCPYPELDEKDIHPDTIHLVGFANNEIAAYARLLPPGLSFPSVSIGRVLTVARHRGNGLGHELISKALEVCKQTWPGLSIEIGAQEYLAAYYKKYGFEATSTMYLEDGIPHIDMILTK